MFKLGDKVIAFKNDEEYEGEIIEMNEMISYGYVFYKLKLLDGKHLITREDFIRYK